MLKIVLISCSKKKLLCRAQAQYLYSSPLFQKSFKYAQQLSPDKIFILSAKHHLLSPHKIIYLYDKTLDKMKAKEVKKWSLKVLKQLQAETDLQNDKFIFLTGNKYCKDLLPKIKHHKTPLQGMNFGKRLKYLKEHIES